MNVYIFGAGASQAAQNQDTYVTSHHQRSPLTNELFLPQYEGYIAHGIKLDLEESRIHVGGAGGSVESWLTSRWNSIESFDNEKVSHYERTWFGNLTFYMWNLLNSVSSTYPDAKTYSHFLTKLRQFNQKFTLISFNYDTLLDQSYQDVFGSTLSRKEKYLDAKFYKPHGSINWFLKQRPGDVPFSHDRHRGDLATRMRESTDNLYNGAPMDAANIEILDPSSHNMSNLSQIFDYYSRQGYVYPLMFMPLTNKNYDFVRDFENTMMADARSQIASASDIYLIGYSASDDLIHALLESAKPGTKLHVVGRQKSSTDRIKAYTIEKNPKLVDAGTEYNLGFPRFVERFMPIGI